MRIILLTAAIAFVLPQAANAAPPPARGPENQYYEAPAQPDTIAQARDLLMGHYQSRKPGHATMAEMINANTSQGGAQLKLEHGATYDVHQGRQRAPAYGNGHWGSRGPSRMGRGPFLFQTVHFVPTLTQGPERSMRTDKVYGAVIKGDSISAEVGGDTKEVSRKRRQPRRAARRPLSPTARQAFRAGGSPRTR